MRKEFIVVVSTLACDGTPAITIHPINVTDAQYEMGDHYDMAIFEAEELGYEAPFKCFDNSEHVQLLNAAEELNRLLNAEVIK